MMLAIGFKFCVTGIFFCALLTPTIAQESDSSTAQNSSAEKAPDRFEFEKRGAIVYATGDDYELKCDMYVPQSDGPRPIMLAIHGGAWTTGSKFAMIRHARILANRGYVVMAINYRLAPKYKWPAQIHDCKHAVRWIREHAADYNADEDQVFAFGYSAGAHLAAMLGTTDANDGLEGDDDPRYLQHSTRIRGFIGGGTPTNFTTIDGDSKMLTYWLGRTRNVAPEIYRNASPTTFITPDDPVAVLFHGKSDALVPVLSATNFIDAYEKAGLDSKLNLSNDGHASAFSRTGLLIDGLANMESLVAENETKKRIGKVLDWIAQFQSDQNRNPDSQQELIAFIKNRNQKLDQQKLTETFRSARDGQLLTIQWGEPMQAGQPAITETTGVDGVRLLGVLPDQITKTGIAAEQTDQPPR